MAALLLRATAVGAATLALVGSPIAAQAESAIVVPNGRVSLRAEKRLELPQALSFELTVRSPTRARESRFPIVCVGLGIETPRARRFENLASVEFVLEVLRDGDTVERFDLAALPVSVGNAFARANSCDGGALSAAPRLDIQMGDVLRLEARLDGIRSLKRGEVVTLALNAASRALPDPTARRGGERGSPGAPGAEEVALVDATAGVDIPGSLIGPVSRGPRTAGVGLLLPAAVTNARLCLSLTALAGFPLIGGLEHPATNLAAKILVRRVDGSSRRVRLKMKVASDQLIGLVCEERTRAYGAGDEILVNFRLNELANEIPRRGNASIDVSLMAVESQ